MRVRTEAQGRYRLTGVDYDFPGGMPVWNARWAYDAAGNRVSDRLDLARNAWYNNANMLLSRAGQSYTNDWNGNTLAGGGRANIWDSQNRLAQTAFNNVTSAFTYGPDGLRRTATSGSVTTQYILDGQNVVQEVSPSGVVAYLWGPRGPEARIDPSGNALWFLYDGHGNVLGEINSQGVINPDGNGDPTPLRDFEPWGYVLNWQQVADNGNTLMYCGSLGHPSENTTGLIYMRARYYDPLLGRFISEDPAGNGDNWYAYANNEPMGQSDLLGLFGTTADALGSTAMGTAMDARSAGGAAFIGGLAVAALYAAVGLHEADLDLALNGVFAKSDNELVNDAAREIGLSHLQRKELGRRIHQEKKGGPRGPGGGGDLTWAKILKLAREVKAAGERC